MTSPADAAATSRDPSNQILYAASELERTRAAYPTIEPPRPVPMTDLIEDVTKGPTK
jgi:hypothetical protein